MTTYYVGLASTFHDSSISIVNGDTGEVIFSEGTERYLQNKRAFSCPADQYPRIKELFTQLNIINSDIVISFSWREEIIDLEKTMIEMIGTFNTDNLEGLARVEYGWGYAASRLLTGSQYAASCGTTLHVMGNNEHGNLSYKFYDHHLTHAAAACFSSSFSHAACAVIDGYGEEDSLCFYTYEQMKIRKIDNDSPLLGREHSLGLFYAHVCALCGFDTLVGEEWKVMGLASYGSLHKELYELFDLMITVDNLVLKVDPSDEFRTLLESSVLHRKNAQPFYITDEDIAFTGQTVFTEKLLLLLNNLYKAEPSDNLILSGGCALNSTTNGMIIENTPFKKLYIPGAPADDGNSLGGALLAYREDNPEKKSSSIIQSPYLGSTMSELTMANINKFHSVPQMKHYPENICQKAAELLAANKIIGWVQGKAEFGPRSLGNRSILADARSPNIKDDINGKVKFREEFRPLAPSILHEYGDEYFVNYQESPYMERTLMFREEVKDRVPGVVHVNGSGRLQTVKHEWNERFYLLIKFYYDLTGIPLVLNTSFNIMGKPIIHSVEDALAVFFTTGLDALIIEDYLIEK